MIEIRNVSKTFNTAEGCVEALKNVSISIEEGDIFGIIGLSGAGKSTLVRCINMLERPDSGTIEIDGCDLGTLSDCDMREVRRDIAMIFQGFNLLMQKNCLKNVCFPLELIGKSKAEANRRALELLEIVGLKDKAKAYPAQLSGGQQQRVAIARALATNPRILLCDEATSALDPKTTNSILELIRSINEKLGITVIMITHQMSVVESICRHVAILDEGKVAEQGSVFDVFSHPRSFAAKRLVFPEGEFASSLNKKGRRLIRVIFNGADSSKTALIAKLVSEQGNCVSILNTNTKSVNDKVYGHIVLSVKDEEKHVRTVMESLQTIPDIIVKEDD